MRRLSWMTLLLAAACSSGESATPPTGETSAPEEPAPPEEPEVPLRELIADAGFEALPGPEELDEGQVLLGRRLFHDPGLSGDQTIACATCHLMSHAGAEPRAKSIGIRGWIGELNAPTVLNAAIHAEHGWLGQAEDLEGQITSHLEDPHVLDAGDWSTIAERLEERGLEDDFEAAFEDDDITRARILTALDAYLRALSTPSDFDRWLEGEDDALDEPEQRGLRRFVQLGCAECHTGAGLGGHELAELGVENDYFERRGGRITAADRGRPADDEGEAVEHRFRIAPLRNVAVTAPYFHDGSEPALEGAVRTMAEVQLDRALEDNELADLVAFLGALSGAIPDRAYQPGARGAPEPEEDAPEEPAEAEGAPAAAE